MKKRIALLALAAVALAQAEEYSINNYRRGLYRAPQVPPASLSDSPRIETLIRAGNLYLSVHDAIELAIENNLDVYFQRLNPQIAQTDILRAKGGGLLRGITTGVSEVPSGIGGPGAPLINAAASGSVQNTNALNYTSDLAIISEGQTNSSVLPSTPFSNGPAVPIFDPAVVGTISSGHQSVPQTNVVTAGSPNLITRSTLADISYVQGFGPGTQILGSFNNSFISTNSVRSRYNPYSIGSLGVTITQPLLRGFGVALNRRFIRIAKNDEKISDLVFKQQLISTVSGVIRLYQDFLALTEDMKVKQQTLEAAQKLYEDNKNKVDVGTLAPVEVTRAQAQVAAARQDLINSQGYVQQQELILKSVLTKRFTADPVIRSARIVPTDQLQPPSGPSPSEDELLREANANRPDLLYSGIQIENAEVSLEGSRNQTKPQLDLIGILQNNGLAGPLNPLFTPLTGTGQLDTTFVGNYGDVLGQLFRRNYPTYQIGVNLTLPLKNRVAEADAIRDELQLRQAQIRRQQLTNQARLEVEDALVALERTRAAYEAAVEARKLQEESYAIEQERYNVGLSTTFLVLQYQSLVAQSRSTEITAKSNYAKAQTALDRAVGLTLDRNNVSVADAYKGTMKP
jgi:outer membrane protein TolC